MNGFGEKKAEEGRKREDDVEEGGKEGGR